MISNEITDYVEGLIGKRTELVLEMEKFAKEHDVPIMELIGMETMLTLLRMKQPKKILEVGTAIGYSAIRMAQELPRVEIVTIERDKERYEKALEYIERAQLSNRINVLYGDALEQQGQAGECAPYDCIFIDAAKGQYQKFFELYTPFLSKQGIVISDNVLFKGFVAKEEEASKRTRKIAMKIRHYNEWLFEQVEYDTTLLPVGDGIAVSQKR
ncbi:O-methyltransferase [Bacillus solimangrovi]|uniref:tRNA 5-hydroxyuridine methyltransferase n=1 Tax=Bacillus solimangrovi TaxID=1305675 RepID=A0A1E5LBT3_9BACI|nr:O-methyltransferase [Bacillus solimangrovi]OEH91546.1 SAM-dependent methyltransferase [Bacillus solimangrovi]